MSRGQDPGSPGHIAASTAVAQLDEHRGNGRTPIGGLRWRQRSTVEGVVRSVRVAPLSGAPTLQVELWDDTGGITLVFYGRRQVSGLETGRRVRATGMVGDLHGTLAISNPTYELVPG